MPTDSSCTVLAALPQLQLMFGLQHGVTPDQLCQTAAVSPLELVDRERVVPYGWYRALWDALEHQRASAAHVASREQIVARI